jgi:hypothetical protein
MRKNATTTLILSVVFLALLGWYFGYEKNLKTKSQETEEKTKQLFTLKPDEIQELEFTREKNAPENAAKKDATPPVYETVKLKKSGDRWLVTEPVQDDADHSTVQSMVTTLSGAKQERIVEDDPKSLETYGLNPPLFKIVARKDSSKAEEVHLGYNTEVGFSIYAKIPSQKPVYKISRSLRNSFDKDAKAVRAKTVLNGFAQNDVTEVEIQSPKENIVIKRGEKDQWILARENMATDATEWNKALATLIDMKIVDFPSEKAENLSAFGLEKPHSKFWITKKDQKNRIGVWIGKAKDKAFAKREDKPVIMEVEKSVLATLEKPALTYRSLALANFNRFEIKRVKIERGAEKFELLKEGTGWQIPSEPGKTVDDAKVDTLLTGLQDTKMLRFAPDQKAKLPIKNPSLTISIFEKKEPGDAATLALTFAKPANNEALGSRSDLSFPFVLKADDLSKINLSKDSFLKKPEKTEAEETKAPKPS